MKKTVKALVRKPRAGVIEVYGVSKAQRSIK